MREVDPRILQMVDTPKPVFTLKDVRLMFWAGVTAGFGVGFVVGLFL
jgi:hypothetical protein